MDAITTVSYYFPTASLTSFWILTNLIVNNKSNCQDEDRSLLIAILVIFSIMVVVIAFTDTYIASNSQSYAVLVIPMYGPVCFSLPTVEDKDRVYDNFYLKVRDYVHALVSLSAFLVTVMFLSPVVNCLFPSGDRDGSARFADSVVRTIPILMALMCGLVMTCLGPPRQMLGLSNVPETCLPVVHEIDNPMFEKDMYTGSRGGAAPSIPEGEEYEMGPPPQMAPAPAPNPALSRRQTAEVESDGGDEFRRSPRDDFRQQSHGFGNNAGSSRQYSQEFGQHNNFNSGRAPAQNRPVSPSSRSRDPSQSRPISPVGRGRKPGRQPSQQRRDPSREPSPGPRYSGDEY